MEAWEELAPELPGYIKIEDQSWPEGGNEWCIVVCGGDVCNGPFETREQAEEHAWAILGGRKAYAELIAPGLVRRAAGERFGGSLSEVCLTFSRADVVFTVYVAGEGPYEGDHCAEEHEGPDICTAALATIKALKGCE